jgi:putative ABC transport system substrate-binding protein
MHSSRGRIEWIVAENDLREVLARTHASLAAQPAGKLPRVGFLGLGSPSDSRIRAYLAASRQRLRELGYVEGQNIAVEYRWAEGKYERLPDLAVERVALNVDASVAWARDERAAHPTPLDAG